MYKTLIEFLLLLLRVLIISLLKWITQIFNNYTSILPTIEIFRHCEKKNTHLIYYLFCSNNYFLLKSNYNIEDFFKEIHRNTIFRHRIFSCTFFSVWIFSRWLTDQLPSACSTRFFLLFNSFRWFAKPIKNVKTIISIIIKYRWNR